MNYSQPLLVALRRFGRRLGVLSPLIRIWRKTCGKYEQKFALYMISRIKDGDVVWDVGANVGFFTEKFANTVGSQGRVVAFEPSPESIARLKNLYANYNNVVIECLALADFDGNADFAISNDPMDPTNSLAIIDRQRSTITVRVQRGETYLFSHPECAPRCIKIDVEGFELEVLNGLGAMLVNPTLALIFIEVHFGILAARGMPNGPSEIADALKRSGFAVRWIDSSHLAAERLLGSELERASVRP